MRNFINMIHEMTEDQLDASYEHEKHIEKLIRFAFGKIKLEISHDNYSVMYMDTTREAEVQLDSESATLTQLSALKETGLSDEFTISVSGGFLMVSFVVVEGLETAQIV